jgi:hypothetical protein
LKKSEAKFMAYDWDGGEFKWIPTNNIVDAIHTAWNYEMDVYEIETENIIFSGRESNEVNSEWLEPYGLRLIDQDKYRALLNLETGEVYKADWQKE